MQTEEKKNFLEYIAHPSPDSIRKDQTLEEHLNNVAKLAAQFAFLFPKTAELLGLCHDIGKSSEEAQEHLFNHDFHNVDHSTAGAQYLKYVEDLSWKTLVDQKSILIPMTMPIISHHGGLKAVGTNFSKGTPDLFGRLKKKEIPEYYVPENLRKQIHDLVSQSKIELSESYLKHAKDDLEYTNIELTIKYLLSSLVDADWTDTKNYFGDFTSERLSAEERKAVFEKILTYLNEKKNLSGINQYRSEILSYAIQSGNNNSGIYSLTAPTGSGKTRSSLGFAATHALAHSKDRIIYVVPYNTISDQYYSELSEDMGLGEKVIQHTSSFDPGDDEEKYRELTSNWDSPVIITSVVQFFETLAASKTSKLRKMHNIANSVIIFDEVQNFPISFAKYLLKLLRCLNEDFGCTILMMSATMIDFEPVDEGFRSTEILPDSQKYAEIFSRSLINDGPRVIKSELGIVTKIDIVNHLKKYKSGICIVNRRKTAKEIYKCLKENIDCETACYCLTKDQHFSDRKKTIDSIVHDLKTGKKCYVVSTSLIEAGIDISAECVLREFAGLENIIQAAGRCNRNGEFEHGYFSVFELVDTKPPRYLKYRYDETKIIYHKEEDPFSLESIQKYFKCLTSFLDNDAKKIILQQKKMNYPEISKRMRIIEDDMVSIIIPSPEIECEYKRLETGCASKKDLKKISKYTVEVLDYVVEKNTLILKPVEKNMYILYDNQYYNAETGLELDQEIEYVI